MTNKEMIETLRNNICEVTFQKRDGSERVMICTLKRDFLPYVSVHRPEEDREQNDLIAVWDIEERAWRSFKPSRVTDFEYSPE